MDDPSPYPPVACPKYKHPISNHPTIATLEEVTDLFREYENYATQLKRMLEQSHDLNRAGPRYPDFPIEDTWYWFTERAWMIERKLDYSKAKHTEYYVEIFGKQAELVKQASLNIMVRCTEAMKAMDALLDALKERL